MSNAYDEGSVVAGDARGERCTVAVAIESRQKALATELLLEINSKETIERFSTTAGQLRSSDFLPIRVEPRTA